MTDIDIPRNRNCNCTAGNQPNVIEEFHSDLLSAGMKEEETVLDLPSTETLPERLDLTSSETTVEGLDITSPEATAEGLDVTSPKTVVQQPLPTRISSVKMKESAVTIKEPRDIKRSTNSRQFRRKLREKRRGTGLGPDDQAGSLENMQGFLSVISVPQVIRSAEDLLALSSNGSETDDGWRSVESLVEKERPRRFSEVIGSKNEVERRLEDYKHTINSLRLVRINLHYVIYFSNYLQFRYIVNTLLNHLNNVSVLNISSVNTTIFFEVWFIVMQTTFESMWHVLVS